MASLQSPYSNHGVATELAWRSIAFLRSAHGDFLRSYDPFTALPWRSQCVHCTFTTSALSWWHIEDAVKGFYHLSEVLARVLLNLGKIYLCHHHSGILFFLNEQDFYTK